MLAATWIFDVLRPDAEFASTIFARWMRGRGMVMKVQGKYYLPGYNSMREIKEDARSSWSWYFQDKKFSEHLYNNHVPKLVDGCSEHDKGMIRRTMLEHEAIFRKQVYELHRLYRIQKDLMNQFQTRGYYGSFTPAEASHSNSFSSQMQSECTEKILQISHLPLGNSGDGKTPFAGTERSHFSFSREGNVRSDHFSSLNGASQKDTEALEYKPLKKRRFNLQLPADVYIDTEDTDGSVQTKIVELSHSASIFKNGNCSLYSENDVKLTLGSDHKEEHQILNSPTQFGISACSAVDLNKPITEICYETPAKSASIQLLGFETHSNRNQEHLLSLRSKTNFIERHINQQTTSDLLHKDVLTKREWPLFNHESANKGSTVDSFSQTFYDDNVSTSSETLQSNTKKCHEFSLFNYNNQETWSRQEPIHNIQASLRLPHITCSNSSLVSPSTPSTMTTPKADLISSASSFVSSWIKPAISISNRQTMVQALPCFSVSSNLPNGSLGSKIDAQVPVTCQNWKNSKRLSTSLGSDIRVPHANGYHHGLHLESSSELHTEIVVCKPDKVDDANRDLRYHLPENYTKHFSSRDLKTHLDLNQVFPSDVEDKITFRQDRVICDVNDKVPEDPSSFRNKASYNEAVDLRKYDSRADFCFSNGHRQLISSSNVVAPGGERNEGKELDFSLCTMPEVTSASQFKHYKVQGNEVSDNNGTIILGFPLHKTTQQSSISASLRRMGKHLSGNTTKKNGNMIIDDLSCDIQVLNSQDNIHIGDSITEICSGNNRENFRNHIRPSAEFACRDEPIPSKILPRDETVVQSSYAKSSAGAKIASNIDSEANISQAQMAMIKKHKHIPSSKKDGSEEKDYSGFTLVRLAAENLVAISMGCRGHPDDTNSHPSSLSRFDTLCWFADVVASCRAENLRLLGDSGDGGTQSSDDDGLDIFEAMTLKLQEIKVDQYWLRSKELEIKDEHEGKQDVGAASLLFTKSRRGQARKRRQRRRDFQKDILPGLASLSRHEVTEDLQTIGGMMKVSGRPWQTGLTRRNIGQSGINSQTNRRKQPRSLSITFEEIGVSSLPPSQPSNSEITIDKVGMIGWGRTTRRCRRQRCLPVILATH
ncbi:uncharacterized protein LOC135672874 isoform X1 [Musa acuminata AAA Group]|uniref:uncharacterized protein LOC135672874 isoform X1 n=2 Tax=Musa acuminata AAA Group TaxID=214697 RepID=UPI0031E1D98E